MRIIVLLVIALAMIIGCDEAQQMMPDTNTSAEVTTTSADSDLTHFCDGYEEWRDMNHEVPIAATEDFTQFPHIQGYGISFPVDKIEYGLILDVDYPIMDYEIGDWITVRYHNSPRNSDVKINRVYLCVNTDLVDTGGQNVFKADTKGHAELRFRLLPKLKRMDTVDSTILAVIVFADGYVTYSRIASLWKQEQKPLHW